MQWPPQGLPFLNEADWNQLTTLAIKDFIAVSPHSPYGLTECNPHIGQARSSGREARIAAAPVSSPNVQCASVSGKHHTTKGEQRQRGQASSSKTVIYLSD
jgi:hypothetical protein